MRDFWAKCYTFMREFLGFSGFFRWEGDYVGRSVRLVRPSQRIKGETGGGYTKRNRCIIVKMQRLLL